MIQELMTKQVQSMSKDELLYLTIILDTQVQDGCTDLVVAEKLHECKLEVTKRIHEEEMQEQ